MMRNPFSEEGEKNFIKKFNFIYFFIFKINIEWKTQFEDNDPFWKIGINYDLKHIFR